MQNLKVLLLQVICGLVRSESFIQRGLVSGYFQKEFSVDSRPNKMAGERLVFKEVLPKQGLLFTEQTPMPVLCKPKIMPMKSVTLEKLETMQKEAQEAVKRQEEEQKLQGVFT